MSALIARWTRAFAIVGLVLMTLIIAWQVFARYVLNASTAWAEQAALLLMIWYVMLAAAAGVREGFHIRISAFAGLLPERGQRWLKLVTQSLVGLFGLAMAGWGAELMLATWSHTIPTLGLPRGLAYLPLVLAGLLIAGFAAEQVAAAWRRREVPPTWN